MIILVFFFLNLGFFYDECMNIWWRKGGWRKM